MAYKEKEITKLYYTIGEVAEMFEVKTSTIRFWENEFSILKPRKNKKGNRLFTPKDIENLKIIIHLLKDRKYTIEGAKKKLKENKDGIVNDLAFMESLKKVRQFLEDLKENL